MSDIYNTEAQRQLQDSSSAIQHHGAASFRHSGFFVHRDSGMKSITQLNDRCIGVPQYQMTAALWMRGIMTDEYNVNCSSIHWRTGALDKGVRRSTWLHGLSHPKNSSIRQCLRPEIVQRSKKSQDMLFWEGKNGCSNIFFETLYYFMANRIAK